MKKLFIFLLLTTTAFCQRPITLDPWGKNIFVDTVFFQVRGSTPDDRSWILCDNDGAIKIYSELKVPEVWITNNGHIAYFEPPSLTTDRTLTLPDTNATLAFLRGKHYVATITQSGTAAPTAFSGENDFGSLVWTRAGAGDYRCTLAASFTTASHTWVSIQYQNPTATSQQTIVRFDANTIRVQTYDGAGAAADGILNNTSVEIRYYP